MSRSSMQIKFWGVRGSLPSPLTPSALNERLVECIEEFLDAGHSSRSDIPGFMAKLPAHRKGGFGGNTPCIEVKSGDTRLVVDGGSGIRSLGYELLNGPCGKGTGEVHLLFTHFHWDHLVGLPFFTPLFIPGNKIHVYAVQPELPEIFRTLFRKPYFPVPLEQLGSEIIYHQLKPRQPVRFGDITVTPYQLDHPDPCWGYRFDCHGKSFSHCVDTECRRITPEELGEDLKLYQNLDVMVFDAQYTLMETIEKVNWGHAAAGLGIDLALRENIRRVVFMHHDPASSDSRIAAVEAQTRRYYELQQKQAAARGESRREVEWEFAVEGMVIDL